MSKLSPHAFLKNSALTKKILSNSAQICIKEYALKNASKYPKSNIRLFLLSTFLCTMGFLRFLALKMLKSQKRLFPRYFIILNILSTLKLQFLNSQISQFLKSGYFESIQMPQNQFLGPNQSLGATTHM